MLWTDAYGGFAWQGQVIDTWLAKFLASPQGVNKLEKLCRARASERHLVIVLDSFSQPASQASVYRLVCHRVMIQERQSI